MKRGRKSVARPPSTGKRWTKAPAVLLGAALLASLGVSACGAAGPSFDEGESVELGQAVVTPVTVSFQNGVLPTSAYAGSIDATIKQANSTTNFGSATTCEADGDDGSGVDKSCLLKWTVSGIPTGSTVQSASITLRVTDGSSNTYSLYELSKSWDEAQVTWQRATSSLNWSSAGALGASDRGSLVGSLTGNAGSLTTALNAAGVAVVQQWVDGTSNQGVVVAHATNTNGIDFASSEHGTVAYHPTLTITYLPPDGSSGAGGSGGSAGTGGTAGSGGSAGTAGSGGTGAGTATDPDLLVAFIGDQGANGNSDAVLNLIKNEGAAAAVHNGDFDYASNATAWDNRINGILGANFPYFAVIGNHDAAAWSGSSGYASKIAARQSRVPAMGCTGELGVKSTCNFRGLFLVQSCVGTSELRSSCGKDSAEQVSFIRDSLASSDALWSVCSWHKNQNDMQVGSKGDEVGWNAYKECMNAGAIVSTGHEHSYSRTLALTDVGNRAGGHGATGTSNVVQMGAGRNFVFVSGLAGVGIRDYEASSHDDDTWWASYYANNKWKKNGTLQTGTGTYGATFIRFNVGGDPKKATAYFKDVNGRLADEFTIQVP